MPNRDGTGPIMDAGQHQRRNRQHYGNGLGVGGSCVCASCGYQTRHDRGHPCALESCPKCGAKLERAA